MSIDIVKPPKRLTLAPAKQRILDTADRLFYDEGIRAVGIDRLIAESSVTKATFYKHYGSKDRLITEYIANWHLKIAEELAEVERSSEAPLEFLNGIADFQQRFLSAPEFRGCPFLNAAAEFTDAGHPVRRAIDRHRDWFYEILETLLRQLGHPLAGDAADDLMLAHDGAMSGGYAGDRVAASAALARMYERVTLSTQSTKAA